MRLEIANRHGLQHRLQPLKPYDARSSRCGRVSRRSPSIAKASAASEDDVLSLISVEASQDGSFTLYRFGSGTDISNDLVSTTDSSNGAKVVEAKSTGKKFRSSWDAKEVGNEQSAEDYLTRLGKTDDNININTGQDSRFIDTLFTGDMLGKKSDLADGTLRKWEFRSFNNLVGDYYVAPRFLETVAMHITKNYLVAMGWLDHTARIPLILGIWGGKGQGKTFQTELAFKKLGLEAVVMSAGELEHEWAGTPGRLIRDRYRKAAEMSKVRGKLSCLVINDIDAGIGRFENTQCTVNNQMVTGTLMNICDNPTRVTLYDSEWREEDEVRRTPIIVTGNDFSTVFAPLIRDGRMDKFYWAPTKEDKQHILFQMYKDDGMTFDDMGYLLDRYPAQTLDFYGAARSSVYDSQIREWIKNDIVNGDICEENENLKELGRRLVHKDNLPKFEPIQLTLDLLFEQGDRLVREQEMVMNTKLSDQYLKKQRKLQKSMIGLSG